VTTPLAISLVLVFCGTQDGNSAELVQTIPMPKVEGRIDHPAFGAKTGEYRTRK
jgi:hypothetical protein